MIEFVNRPHDRTQNFLRGPKLDKGKPQGREKRRATLRAVSPAQDEKNKTYNAAKASWQKVRTTLDNFQCEFTKDGKRCGRKASPSPHHRKGRGKLLCDTVWFMAVCPDHHRFIHDNPKFAYENGMMIKRI